jgi:N-acetylneuraminic acid mutarotase
MTPSRFFRFAILGVAVSLLLAACGGLGPADPGGSDGSLPGLDDLAPLPAGPGAWTASVAMTEGRQEAAFSLAAGRFHLAGGSGPGGYEDMHEVYDDAAGTWSTLRPLPVALDHVQAVELFERVFYVGGLEAWPGPHASTVYAYDPLTDTFELGGDMGARGRGAGGVVAHEGRIYYAGGLHGDGGPATRAVPWFDVYDPATETWQELPDMPHARDHFHAVVVDDRLYAIGGRDLAVDATIDAIDVYDFRDGAWRTLEATLPTARGGYAAAVLGREILIIGGESGTGVHDEVEAFDTAAGTWRDLAPLPAALHGIQAAVCDGSVFVAGGGAAVGDGAPRSEMHVFTFDGSPGTCGGVPVAPTGIDWLANGNPDPVMRAETNGVVVDGRLFIPGGFEESFDAYCATRSTVAYDPFADVWEALPDLPADWTHGALATDGRWVHVAGGRRVAGADGCFPDPADRTEVSESVIWSYDVQGREWRDDVLPPLPGIRSAGGMALVDRTVHFFGGVSEMAVDEDGHWALDLDAETPVWEPRAPMPMARNHFGTAQLAGRIYAVGGQYDTGFDAQIVRLVHRYDPLTDSWERLADLPSPASHIMGATLSYGHGLLVAGGDTEIDVFLDDVNHYDPATDAWTTIGAIPDAHQAAVAGIVDGRLVVSHGNFEQTTFRGEFQTE